MTFRVFSGLQNQIHALFACLPCLIGVTECSQLYISVYFCFSFVSNSLAHITISCNPKTKEKQNNYLKEKINYNIAVLWMGVFKKLD